MQYKNLFIVIFLFVIVNLFASEKDIEKSPLSVSTRFLNPFTLTTQIGVTFPHISPATFSVDYYCINILNSPDFPVVHIFDFDWLNIPKNKYNTIFGMGIRASYLRGYPGTNSNFCCSGEIYSNKKKSILKLGMNVLLRSRIALNDRLFLEPGIKVGFYFIGGFNQLYGSFFSTFFDQDLPIYMAFDILKIGYKFGKIPARKKMPPPTLFKKRKKAPSVPPVENGFGIAPNIFLFIKTYSSVDLAFVKEIAVNHFSNKYNANAELVFSWKDFSKVVEYKHYDILRTFELDLRVKKYMGGERKIRPYYAIGFKYHHLKGFKNSVLNYIDKGGIEIGLGANIFVKKHLYFDLYLVRGIYVFGKLKPFDFDDELVSPTEIVEIGTLRIGYRF